MPMAISGTSGGGRRRTGPAVILPALIDGTGIEVIAPALVRRVLLTGARVTGVEIEDVHSGEISTLLADTVIVCGDALRTPQLLFASGIRPWALGRGLNEHAFLTGRVFASPETLGVESIPVPDRGEWMSDSLWLPQSGQDQPFHWQVSVSPLYSDDLETAVMASVGVSVYIPTEVDFDCRIEFSDTETDVTGMPLARIHYAYSDADVALIERAREEQAVAFTAIAGEDASSNSLLLAPGSSLHYSGTVRMGTNPATSVADVDGHVHGIDGLYVAGNGVLPTAVVGNVTPAGSVTAVRAARAVVARLGS